MRIKDYREQAHAPRHICAKPSALSQHQSQLLARARGGRAMQRVVIVYVLISCSRPRPAPKGAGRGREYENMSSRASHVKYHAS